MKMRERTVANEQHRVASGPNNIPYKILVLLKKEISKQLGDLFNISFITGVFLSVSCS